eukprot:3141190-Alexandrium_andersonii.AAC.1
MTRSGPLPPAPRRAARLRVRSVGPPWDNNSSTKPVQAPLPRFKQLLALPLFGQHLRVGA